MHVRKRTRLGDGVMLRAIARLVKYKSNYWYTLAPASIAAHGRAQ